MAENNPSNRPQDEDQDYGQTLGDTPTSYSSIGGSGKGERELERALRAGRGMRFQSGPGDIMEEVEDDESLDIPYSGESMSTRGATFGENPDTGETIDEEDGEFLRESLEKRTRRYESG